MSKPYFIVVMLTNVLFDHYRGSQPAALSEVKGNRGLQL